MYVFGEKNRDLCCFGVYKNLDLCYNMRIENLDLCIFYMYKNLDLCKDVIKTLILSYFGDVYAQKSIR